MAIQGRAKAFWGAIAGRLKTAAEVDRVIRVDDETRARDLESRRAVRFIERAVRQNGGCYFPGIDPPPSDLWED